MTDTHYVIGRAFPAFEGVLVDYLGVEILFI